MIDPDSHPLEHFAAAAVDAHPDASGCVLLGDGRMALKARLALAGLAAATLDVQYYLWHDDATGRFLARSLLDAADRGVKVRMLIDDIHLAGRDTGLATLDRHRNIAIRIFNPFRVRAWPSWQRLLEALKERARLNHRMHNKTFIADARLAIVGGRNIGDEYFAASEAANFRDMDLLTIGPVVTEIRDSFQHFWDSALTVPVRSLTPFRPTKRFIRRGFRRMRRAALPQASLRDFASLDRADLVAHLAELGEKLHWGQIHAIYDLPGKVSGAAPPRVAEAMLALLKGIEKELVIETAYFIPDRESLEALRGLRNRGIDITVLTNSLASNDVIAAHAGYASQRRELLDMGIRLYEVRSGAARQEPTVAGTRVGARASLHSKAAVFDRAKVFIGTLNFDPRSLYINTEIGLIVDSPGLAAEVAGVIGRAMEGDTSFRVALAGDGSDGRLQWYPEGRPGMAVAVEPEATWLQRCLSVIYQRLPIQRWL